MIEVKVEKRGAWYVARTQRETLAKSRNGDTLRRIYRAAAAYKVVTKWT